MHRGQLAIDGDIGAKTRQFRHVHVAVLENRLANLAGAIRHGHQGHELRLQIGGKARERVGFDINWPDAVAIAIYPQALVLNADLDTRLGQYVESRLQMLGAGTTQQHIAPGHRRGHRKSAGLDAVRDHVHRGAMQALDAFNRQRARADAADLGAHGHEAFGDIGDFGLLGHVFQDGRASGQAGGHQQGMGRTDRNLGELDMGADETTLGRLGHHIAFIDLDFGAQRLEAKKEHVDRTRADGAAARQRDARLVAPRQQRSDHPEAGTHPRHQFIGRRGVDDIGGMKGHALAYAPVFAAPAAMHGDIDAVIFKDALELLDVGQARHVLQHQRLIAQQRSNHQRQGGVLGAGNGDFAIEFVATDQTDTVHKFCPLWRARSPSTWGWR